MKLRRNSFLQKDPYNEKGFGYREKEYHNWKPDNPFPGKYVYCAKIPVLNPLCFSPDVTPLPIPLARTFDPPSSQNRI
jgi:hypothetical protein